MENIYLEKNNSMEHFISFFDEDWFGVIDNTTSISESAFAYSDTDMLLFKNCTPDIGEKAFEGCESLVTVIFGEPGTDETIERSVLKNLKLAAATGDYVIQADAFKDCTKLATLVLPEVNGKHRLVIENDAFCACGSLRTVVALCDTIDFTGNPFANEAEHLTFVCKENSGVARFAREHGYRSVYVD